MNAAASISSPSDLSVGDLSQAQLFIKQTRDCLLGSVKTLRPEQWAFKPGAERWSIAEIVEHVTAVQERVIGMIGQQLASAPPPPPEQDREIVDSIVIHQIPNRLVKFPSPIPMTAQLDGPAATGRYVQNCDALAGMLTSTPGLRDHVLDSPPLKAVSKGAYSLMDGYQWILAAAAHSERHTKQILEVIADSAFPG